MNKAYTNVALRGNNILLRGVENGKRFSKKIRFQPTLYVPTNQETKWRTLEGICVEAFKPGDISDCRDFVKTYDNVGGISVYGNTEYIYQFIGEEYGGEIDYNFNDLVVANIDIETTCDDGFPDVENPNEEIIAITVEIGGMFTSFGVGEFSIDGVGNNIVCHNFQDELDLIKSFLDYWEVNNPDIITGWNVRFFDIPYLVNRIRKLLGEKESNRLSPWKKIGERTIRRMNRDQVAYELVGIATLDYYELYQTFTYVNQESYRLDHIAFVELGEKKLSYDEYDSMATFYKSDFQKFMEYNVKDVELISKLENKMKLLELSVALAYSAKVNLVDVFSQVRTWDAIIYHYLMEHNVVIPPKKAGKKDEQYAGAYVKDPIVGMHDWVVSFDLNSLYPHLIMQYNISPETKTNDGTRKAISVDGLLGGNHISIDYIDKLKGNDVSIAANGICYSRERKGFLPSLMEKMYQERKMYKGKMIECQKRQQAGERGLENDIAKYHNFQLVRKIQLNSAYGAIGNQYFRYYDVDMAESITISGQLSIRWIEKALNKFFNETLGTENYEYVIASDTDSVYLRLGNLVSKTCENKSKKEIVDFLDKASREIILPFIEKKYNELAEMMNAYENKMVMGRECIADKAVWTAKKRYMMRVHDSEGVRYETPKTKIMGIETTRSSTPQVVRDSLKEAINLILTTDEDTVIDFIEDFRGKFKNFEPEEIAFPRGVNGLNKYVDKRNIYRKSTPIAVKGALIYNHYLRKHKLQRKYRGIMEGEKIKFLYLKTPNPCGGAMGQDQVISFANSLPKEFGLNEYIDYDVQFQKAFLDPIKNILEKIGWNHEHVSTLESFFG